jgi:hypothetical protein
MLEHTRIVPIEQADLRLVHRPWSFAHNNLAEIDAHWQRRTAEQPRLYNGCVLMLDSWSLSNGRFAGECVATNYKNFLYWRERKEPTRDAADFFPAAGLHSREGWLIRTDGLTYCKQWLYLSAVRLATPANRIERFLKSQQEPELAGVFIAKSTADIKPIEMPPFAIAYIEHRFG